MSKQEHTSELLEQNAMKKALDTALRQRAALIAAMGTATELIDALGRRGNATGAIAEKCKEVAASSRTLLASLQAVNEDPLMSADPDLYEALEEFLNALMDAGGLNSDATSAQIHRLVAAKAKAKTALAAARGETP